MGAAEIPAVPAPGACGDALAGAHRLPRSQPVCPVAAGRAAGGVGGGAGSSERIPAGSERAEGCKSPPLLREIGLEAGPLSQWLFAGMKAAGLAVELLETRHVRAAFKTMPVKTDRKDARGIAQLMRLGWFRPVHCKSLPAQEVRALLTTRKLLQAKRHD